MTIAPEATEAIQSKTAERLDASSASGGNAHDNRDILLIVVASVLATIPVWLASFPPMVDLPEHAAQVAMLRNLHNPNFHFAELFWVNWFTPYLLGYMLMYALTPLLGIVTAAKLVVAVALAAVPVATALLAKETGADPYWALLTIPAMYGFNYGWGFLNFVVAAPIGLLFLVLFVRHTRKPTLRSSVYVALLSIVLFFSHALTYLVFAAVAVLYALLETGKFRKAVVAVSPVAAALPLTTLWYLREKADPATQGSVVWDLGWLSSTDPHTWGGRLTGFFPRLIGLSSPLLCVLFGIALFALPFLAGVRLSRRLSIWAPLAVCVAVIFFGPTGGHSGWALSQRFAVFALPFFVIVLEKSPGSRPAWRAAPVFLLVAWLAVVMSVTVRYDADARGFKQILKAMEPHERALSLIFIQHAPTSPAPVYIHFPSWYAAAKEGVVDMNFAEFPVALVRYRPTAPAPNLAVSEWYPERFRWEEWSGDKYRYFVVHAPVDLGNRLFAWAPCPVSLVAQSGIWWLYEKDPRCTAAPEH